MSGKKLGFGLMRLPSLDPNDPGKIDIEQVKKMGRSRARPPYRPAPQFNHYSAKENEHERIDLHPLRSEERRVGKECRL